MHRQICYNMYLTIASAVLCFVLGRRLSGGIAKHNGAGEQISAENQELKVMLAVHFYT